MFDIALQVSFDTVSADATLLASAAIILGTVFVVIEMRDNRKLVEASLRQANTSAMQLRQNYELSTVDLITKIYDFANSLEVQRSWYTVVNTKISSIKDFERLPEEKQLAFHQVASLFESVGLLVERGYVKEELVNDMFATQLAWRSLEPFVKGMREKYASEDYYVWMEKLHDRVERLASTPGAAGA
ncbi:MAG TPA: DUF4760 domain-containing protein [Nitrososphaerales archaeon]|nr:DUF4760 domain-containing protein [Nitrososphaerales archaeon]